MFVIFTCLPFRALLTDAGTCIGNGIQSRYADRHDPHSGFAMITVKPGVFNPYDFAVLTAVSQSGYEDTVMLLPRSFFNRPAPQVAKELPGMRLVHRIPGGVFITAQITETEAYDGFDDRASHASHGMTARNAVMFGPPGHIYLYLCYGMHWMLNISTGPVGYPAAVLLRGTVAVNGPGRLTRYFQLDGKLNARPLGLAAGLWIARGSTPAPTPETLRAAPRVGVAFAGTEWSAMPWRFIWDRP